jgi:AbiTii
VTDVLRKAPVVARKLSVKDFEIWIEKELNGYKEMADLPSYRRVMGEVEASDLTIA